MPSTIVKAFFVNNPTQTYAEHLFGRRCAYVLALDKDGRWWKFNDADHVCECGQDHVHADNGRSIHPIKPATPRVRRALAGGIPAAAIEIHDLGPQ